MSEQSRLTEVVPQPINIPVAGYYPPFLPQQEFETKSPSVPLSHYLWVLRRHRWMMIAFVAVCVLVTAVVTARLQPIYESTATIDVDRQAPSEVVGEDSTRASAPNDADQFLATQIRLIQSDSVLRPVAEQFHLLGHSNSPTSQQSVGAPVSLGQLRVVRPANTYLLLVSYRSPDPTTAAAVANAVANSYLSHTYDLRFQSSSIVSSFMEKQLDELKAKMEKSGMALSEFEKDMDVVNPEDKSNILSARLLQLNTEYTTAQADRVTKEAAWNGLKSNSIEAAQVSSQGASLEQLTSALNQAKQRFAVVKSTYGPSHPEYRKAASEVAELEGEIESSRGNVAGRIEVQYREALNREQMLQQTVAETKGEWDRINAQSFQYQRLKQEADADKALYDELTRKISEADINAGFQNNNIRIADLARPSPNPVFPDRKLNLMLALLFSSLLAIGAVFLQDALDTTLRDPNEASRFLGTDVIGTMPIDGLAAKLPKIAVASSPVATMTKSTQNGKRNGYYSSTSDFDEAVRTLRNTILLSDFEGRLQSLVLTSAAPSEGKTTIAAHLAIANADRGKKTLLVDGDLRRPSLHTKFGLNPHMGFSDVLTGEQLWQDVVVPIEGRPNLSLLPSGPGSHRAADLIGPRLSHLLDEFAKEFDLVILDSPPLLGFAECLQMATAADGVLIISRAAETKRRAVAEVISVLTRLRSNIVGVVLNQVSKNTSSDGYSYYGYYRYGNYQKTD